MSSRLIEKMVNRFLGWNLPKDFCPDAGISFNPTKPYEGDELGNSWWPVGTNLLTADQARKMFEYVTAEECGEWLQPHQQRVVIEKADLDEKLTKLRAFFGTETFANLDDAEMERLQRQADHMSAYSEVLGERIAAFSDGLDKQIAVG